MLERIGPSVEVATEGLSELAQHAAAAGDISILSGFASPLAEVRFNLEDALRTFAI